MAAKKKHRAAQAKTKSKAKARKSTRVPPIPKGAHTVTAYIAVNHCPDALTFYVKAFGAKEIFRLVDPRGRIGHAEIKIGDSSVMMSDPHPEWGTAAPSGPISSRLSLMVKNADAFVAKAVAAGATIVRPVEDQFYGFRGGMIADPFGHSWHVMHQIEKLTHKQLQKRWVAMMDSMAKAQAK